jgi:hypothetical protein
MWMKGKTLSTSVSDDLYERVVEIAQRDYRKPANIVLICLEKYLPVLEKELELKEQEPAFGAIKDEVPPPFGKPKKKLAG